MVAVGAAAPNAGNTGATLAAGAVPNKVGAGAVPATGAATGVPNVRLMFSNFRNSFF